MKKNLSFLIIPVMFLLAGCTAGPNMFSHIPDANGNISGFWMGLWHGIIAPVTFILSLFFKNIHFYEIHNNGGWYNTGFFLGLLMVLGGGGKGAKKKYRC